MSAHRILGDRFAGWQKLALDSSQCPVRNLLDRIGDRWSLLILCALAAEPRRFSALRADMPLISARMLSTRLKDLEAKGLVCRTIIPSSPPTVEYALTAFGRELLPAIQAIAAVGTRLMQQASEQTDSWDVPKK